ncbi:hypothetical protein HMPREF0554_0930 [Pseudoleptotrichia goodfellowii F0264]|uniref:Uncharacterized protein n=1 Tax=Pseudoleptotrichia goodfellowii F0264 TaxID=596323 RepID=D0GJQ1_9FUSO|nr:hypothetical protein HMPREF0554_0930 [Pseudoleptotrichia goodfellowii F0264]
MLAGESLKGKIFHFGISELIFLIGKKKDFVLNNLRFLI